jgi:hypothetical protein
MESLEPPRNIYGGSYAQKFLYISESFSSFHELSRLPYPAIWEFHCYEHKTVLSAEMKVDNEGSALNFIGAFSWLKVEEKYLWTRKRWMLLRRMTDETKKGSSFVIKETSAERDVGACRVYLDKVIWEVSKFSYLIWRLFNGSDEDCRQIDWEDWNVDWLQACCYLDRVFSILSFNFRAKLNRFTILWFRKVQFSKSAWEIEHLKSKKVNSKVQSLHHSYKL